jgi:hypothetical protein
MLNQEDAVHLDVIVQDELTKARLAICERVHAKVQAGAVNEQYGRAVERVLPEHTALTAENGELRARLLTAAERLQSPELREALAAIAHEQWCGWMSYLFKQGTTNADGSFTIQPWAVERWVRQVGTTYADLPEEEKRSDRHEADRVLAVVRAPPSHHGAYYDGIDVEGLRGGDDV